MKKLISLLLVVVILATMLTACGDFTCDMCFEEASGDGHTIEVLGSKEHVCDDCYEEYKALERELDSLF